VSGPCHPEQMGRVLGVGVSVSTDAAVLGPHPGCFVGGRAPQQENEAGPEQNAQRAGPFKRADPLAITTTWVSAPSLARHPAVDI